MHGMTSTNQAITTNQAIAADWGWGKVNEAGFREFPTLNDFTHEAWSTEWQNADGQWEIFERGSAPAGQFSEALVRSAAEAKWSGCCRQLSCA